MSKLRLIRKLALLILGAVALSSGARAQDTQEPETPAKPKPAARGIPSLSDPNATVEDSQAPTASWHPDTSLATGLQAPTLGSPELGHSYWVPGLEYGSTIQSRPPGVAATNGWYANNYAGGDLSLLETWGRSQLGLNYSGGGYFTTDNLQSNGEYQQLSLGENITLNRWQIQAYDLFSYLPESQFGFAGGTNLALPGVGGILGPAVPSLGSSVVPNQSIYSATGSRYSNVFAAQTTYMFSPRSSFTVSGSYGLLRFTQSGNVDNSMATGSLGYNYALGKEDSIGLLYRFTSFHYTGEAQALGNHVANFVYLKKITRRMALNLSGGPQITTFRIPVGTKSHTIGVSTGATLNYAVEHGNVSLSYFHGLTGGSGVLLGSNSDTAMVTLSRQVTRVWGVSADFGYSRNSSVVSPTGVQRLTYNDWFVGGGVSRPFGRNVNLSVAYSARFESSPLICTGTVCSSSYTQNMVSISLQWHTRPFVLR
jgi:hypothetical protein